MIDMETDNLIPSLLLGWGAVLAGGALLWWRSLRTGDVSVVDVFWGPAFVLLAAVYRLVGPAAETADWAQLVLVSLWGGRLAGHIAVRSRGRGEDRRYREMRESAGDARFRRRSLVTVFGLQATLAALLSYPFLVVQGRSGGAWSAWETAGLTVVALGLLCEAFADFQLLRFQREGQPGRVMDRGLWRYSRHPNYFGESLLWWGFAIYALGTPGGGWSLLAAAGVTVLVVRLSGIPLLERDIESRRPGYADYAARTSAFLPLPPRTSSAAPGEGG